MKLLKPLLSILTLFTTFVSWSQIYLADNGLSTSMLGSNATTKKVSLGGVLNDAQTSIDFGSSNFNSNFLFKKGSLNYLYIGNDGKIGIATITPTATLDINGIIKTTGLIIPSGAGINKILVSDASGNATWQTPAAVGITIGQTVTSGTPGFVLFTGTGSTLQQDDGIKYDNTNKRLTINNVVPNSNLNTSSFWTQGIDVGNYYGDVSVATSIATSRAWIFAMYNANGVNRRMSLRNTGQLGLGDFTPGTINTFEIRNLAANNVGMMLRGSAGQLVDILQVTDNLANPYLLVNSAGNIGIGTDVPTAKLHIAGNLKLVDGTQGIGKILTSDALSSRTNDPDPNQWVTEATYRYYLHGPLARMELGNSKVQGVDYAYTLQGWMKGVNGTAPTISGKVGSDMSGDAKGGGPFSNHARDVNGFSLGYYTGDYTPIGGINAQAFSLKYNNNAITESGVSLYNGNISNATYALSDIDNGNTAGYTYRYDQLNRLTAMNRHSIGAGATAWGNSNIIPAYKEKISYDANGNIKTYLRNGAAANTSMDDLTYNYYYYDAAGNKKEYDKDAPLPIDVHHLTNQLAHVQDKGGTTYTDDIKNQDANNYVYDKIGNMITDVSAGLNISWNVYGKMIFIQKNKGNETGTVNYAYDAAGNRTYKYVNNYNTSTGKRTSKKTFYIRDAQGNVLAVYEQEDSKPLTWLEQHLYGSSRIGMVTPEVQFTGNPNYNSADDSKVGNSIVGKRRYEIVNHLGNVIAVISDLKIGVDDNGDGIVDYYVATVLSQNDYYPGGMNMPDRSYNPGSYSYGFNGKRMDNEIWGTGNSYDYGARIYDPRAVRFLSVDPMTKSYPLLTPYQFAANSPIWGIDVDGLEFLPYLSAWFHIKTDVTSYTGVNIPVAVSCFDRVNTSVVIASANVSSVYKDHAERPLFDAMGVGITPNGKYEASNYVEVRSAGSNNLPQNPGWTFSTGEADKDIYEYSEGTKPAYNRSSGWTNAAFKMDSRGGFLNSLDKGVGALQEGMKYNQMFGDAKIWSASVDLSDNRNIFDRVNKVVDATYAANSGLSSGLASNFNRGDLVNFALDGSVPSNSIIPTDAELLRNMSIMYIGIQVINNHTGENNIKNGPSMPWNYHTTHVTNAVKELYKSTVEQYQKRHQQDMSSWLEPLDNK